MTVMTLTPVVRCVHLTIGPNQCIIQMQGWRSSAHPILTSAGDARHQACAYISLHKDIDSKTEHSVLTMSLT